MSIPHRAGQRLRELWTGLRRLSRDDAYERYLAHHAAEHAAIAPLSAREFYLREQQRKWSGISRCC
jgi:uncharacterized short protein YbdD (DUF466 family)